jgi:hypothetical protein
MPPRNRYGLDHLFGNVSIARNIFPRLTGRVRKTDPDGSSVVAYIPSLNGKVLNIEYTRDVASVPTTFTTTVTFAVVGFQAAIDQINGLDAPNIEASDQDGFLSIRNLNPGKTHYIQINSSSNAAPLLGFDQKPTPGYRSVAGEIASAPVDRVQKNPTGTGGIARDETLAGDSLNRALAAFGDVLARLMREQDREVGGFAEVALSSGNLFSLTGKVAIKFASPGITGMRIPITGFPEASPLSQPGLGRLGAFFRIQTTSGEEPLLTNGDLVRITKVLWGNPASVSAINDAQAFSTYSPLPTPTAFSAFGNNPGGAVTKVVKVSSVSISEIRGNVVKCGSSPAFQSGGLVYPGDTVKISSSSVTTPFTHNGEFIVDEVIDDNTLALRPKAKFDPLADSTAEIPPGLNQGTSGMGNLEVLVGPFLNGPGIIILTDCPTAFLSDLNGKILRYATGVRYKEASSDKFARNPLGGMRALVQRLINTDPFVSVATDGASYVGAGDNSDLSLSEGTVRDQLDELAAFWAKLDRENVFTQPQDFNGDVADDSPALKTDAAPAVRKLIWVFNDGVDPKSRLYFFAAGNQPGLEYTYNARWNPGTARFVADDAASNSQILHIDPTHLELRVRDFGETDPFTYNQASHIYLSTTFLSLVNSPWFFLVPGGLQVGDTDMSSSLPRLGMRRATDEETLVSPSAVRTKLLEDFAGIAPAFGPGAKGQLRMFLSPAAMTPGGTLGAYDCDAFEASINADWIGGTFPGQWAMDDPTQPAALLSFDAKQGLQIKIRNTFYGGGPTWVGLDSSSFDDVLQLPTVDQSVPGATGWNSMMGFASPSDTFDTSIGPTGDTKRLVSMKAVPKVWGFISLNTGSPFVVDGWGIASVEVVAPVLRIHFSHDIADSFPAVLLQTVRGTGGDHFAFPFFSSPSFIDVSIVDTTFITRNAGTLDDSFCVAVFGQYTGA